VSNNITDLPPAPTAPPLPDGWISIYSYQIHKKYGFCYPLRIGDIELYYDDKKLIESFDFDNDAPRIPESDIDLDVKVYISKDGALLRSIALQDDLKIKVGSREVLVFLENNEGDISSPAAHIVLGNSAKKVLGLSSVTGNIVDDLELDDEQEHQLRKAAHFSKASFVEELQTVLLENVINSKTKGKNSKQKRWLKFPDKLLNELTDSFFDTVIGTLKKLKISRAIWDPEHKDHKGRVEKFINAIGKSIKAYENKTERYKAKLLKWRDRLEGNRTPSSFNFAYATLESALGVLEMLSNILRLAGQVFEEIKAGLTGTVQFWIGFLCGVINGIIDLISGLLFLLKLAVKALIGSVGLVVSSENRAVFIEQIDNIIQAFQAIEWGKVWESIKKGGSDILPVIGKAIREANPGQIGYFIGIVLFNIAEFFVPLTKLAKIAKTEKIFNAAQTVRASIARISGFAQQAGNDILRGLAQLAAFLRQGTDAVRKLVDDVFAGIKIFLDDLANIADVLKAFSRVLLAFFDDLSLVIVPVRAAQGIDGQIYSVFYRQERIFGGTKEAIVKFSADLKKISKSKRQKYLNELAGDSGGVFNLGGKKIKYDKNTVKFLESKGLKIIRKPRATKTLDIVNSDGVTIFRGIPSDIKKYVQFIGKTKSERIAILKQAKRNLENNANKYKPDKAKEKGYDVPSSNNGTSPDFDNLTDFLYKKLPDSGRVRIKVTGSRDMDFAQANKALNLAETPKGYTWHHLDDLNENLECTMQLVLTEVHEATFKHLGSAKQFQELLDIKKYL